MCRRRSCVGTRTGPAAVLRNLFGPRSEGRGLTSVQTASEPRPQGRANAQSPKRRSALALRPSGARHKLRPQGRTCRPEPYRARDGPSRRECVRTPQSPRRTVLVARVAVPGVQPGARPTAKAIPVQGTRSVRTGAAGTAREGQVKLHPPGWSLAQWFWQLVAR